MTICGRIEQQARLLKHDGHWIYRTWKSDHFLRFWYTTRPRSIDAEGPHQGDQFDIRRLPEECLAGLEIEYADGKATGLSDQALRDFAKVLLHERDQHRQAILRALDAGIPLAGAR